jgi:hypothetical protein
MEADMTQQAAIRHKRLVAECRRQAFMRMRPK